MKKGAMVIPQEAVNELQGSYQVAVVGNDNKVSIRPVKMGERIGAMWEVTEGLSPAIEWCARRAKSPRRRASHGERVDPSRRRVGFKSGPAKEPLRNVRFFVRRPIVAIVIAILMTLIGGVCILAAAGRAISADRPAGDSGANALHGADALTIEQSSLRRSSSK